MFGIIKKFMSDIFNKNQGEPESNLSREFKSHFDNIDKTNYKTYETPIDELLNRIKPNTKLVVIVDDICYMSETLAIELKNKIK